MAEKRDEEQEESREIIDERDSQNKMSKGCLSASPSSATPHDPPRTNKPSSTAQMSDPVEEPDMDIQESVEENGKGPTSPETRRKSWRRSTITRRSLRALPNPYHVLCRRISTSLTQEERLEKLLEASMKLALERTESSLQSVAKASLQSFHKQVDRIQTELDSLTKNTYNETQKLSSHPASEPAVQKAVENIKRAVNRLKAESESWEALLSKHRSRAEELDRKVKLGEEKGITLDSTSMAQSSQFHLIQKKPNYHSLLCRHQPVMQTMEMSMDTQCKIIRQLLSMQEQSQMFVKETSGRLAEEAGLQDLSPNLRNLMSAALSQAAT